jgi:hypothetical protein
MVATLEEFTQRHRSGLGPWIVEPTDTKPGGVDPLGLRQINFDLMDRVFPGLNNVARHIRPFTVVSWAWRRSVQLAKQRNLDLRLSVHQDFVARIEVAYLWSMLVAADGEWRAVDLPGQQRLRSFIGDRTSLRIGNEEWCAFVKSRRNSTALTAAINYGPGLSALRCLESDALNPGVKVPVESFVPALDAFEGKIRPILDHPIFNGWGECTLKRSQVLQWQPLWPLEKSTKEERRAFRERFSGEEAGARRAGFDLLVGCARQDEDSAAQSDHEDRIRRAMCGAAEGADAALQWKRAQVRQAFRLALEAMLEWIVLELGSGAVTTEDLSRRFLAACGQEGTITADQWLTSLLPKDTCPVAALRDIKGATGPRAGLELAIARTLAVALYVDSALQDQSAREDRLPLSSAASDFAIRRDGPANEFLSMAIERWIFSQHTYWSVGRGLADARAGAKTILRLRIVLESDGWAVTGGRGSRGMPRPTPDRLATALSLAAEAGMI